MKHPILFFIILLMAFSACQKIQLQKSDSDVAVVEGYITPGNQLSLKVFRQLMFENGDTTITYLNDLDLKVSNGSQWFTLSNQDSGIYVNPAMHIEPGMLCSLAFEYNGKAISAETTIPGKPESFSSSAASIEAFTFSGGGPGAGGPPEMSDPISLSWLNPDEEYFLIVVENIEDNPSLITAVDDENDRPQPVFRNTPVQSDSLDINAQMFSYYGTHQIILFKLNPEYAALYEQLSNSSLDITAPPTNIVNGLGIFTGINSDTLYVEVVSKK